MNLILEGEGKKGCLMAVLTESDALPIIGWCDANVPAEELTGDGLEHEPHVTVAFGFNHDDGMLEDLQEMVSQTKPVSFALRSITRFDTNPEFDVLKVDVESQDLEDLHYQLREIFGKRLEVTFPDYHAHLTLAYLKKGSCKDLDGHDRFNGHVYLLNSLVYSEPGSKRKHHLALGGARKN